MNFETILFEVSEGVGKITLHRPDKLNSFNTQMHEEIRRCLNAITEDKTVRCVLLTGSGRGFCAGQDLADDDVSSGGDMPDLGDAIERNYNPLVRSIKRLEKPVICAVNGVAAGAGANLALACDIVFAARSASFIQSFSKIGLVPDCGGTWSLPRAVGHARAMALAMLAEKVPAQQAEDWGLIWKCVDDDDLMSVAESQAAWLATQPTQGLALTKRAIHASSSNTLDQQLELERDLQRLAGRTRDFGEGVNAFINKREAKFTGQ